MTTPAKKAYDEAQKALYEAREAYVMAKKAFDEAQRELMR